VSCGEPFKHPVETKRAIKLKAQLSKSIRLHNTNGTMDPKILTGLNIIPKSLTSRPSIPSPTGDFASEESELDDLEMVEI
jgi:hypothetical protein